MPYASPISNSGYGDRLPEPKRQPELKPDVVYVDHGTIVTVEPVSACGRDWFDEHVQQPPDWASAGGAAIHCDHRPGWALIQGAVDDGLVVEAA